jgi:hypothetical protein
MAMFILSSEESSYKSYADDLPKRILAINKKVRPVPIDLAYNDQMATHFAGFNGKSIFPWSIDGLNGDQINRMLNLMTACVNAVIACGGDQQRAYYIITHGFVGILHDWWESISPAAKHAIEWSPKRDEHGEVVYDSQKKPMFNSATALLSTIIIHFCGEEGRETASNGPSKSEDINAAGLQMVQRYVHVAYLQDQ